MLNKKISVEEFDEAVKAVTHDLFEDKDLTGETRILVPMISVNFASQLRHKLFNTPEDTSDKEPRLL